MNLHKLPHLRGEGVERPVVVGLLDVAGLRPLNDVCVLLRFLTIRIDGRPLPADQLYMDNRTGVTRFVRDMLRQGKRRIGFIGDYMHCQSFFERYTALRCAMVLAGVPVEERYCICHNTVENVIEDLAGMEELDDRYAHYTLSGMTPEEQSLAERGEILELLDTARVMVDFDERMAAYQKIDNAVVHEDAVVLPLYQRNHLFCLNPRVHGFKVAWNGWSDMSFYPITLGD